MLVYHHDVGNLFRLADLVDESDIKEISHFFIYDGFPFWHGEHLLLLESTLRLCIMTFRSIPNIFIVVHANTSLLAYRKLIK